VAGKTGMRTSRLAACLALLPALVGGLLAQEPGPTTILLVRHAEKRVDGSDPGLSAAGRARAAELARVLSDVPLAAIYASQFVRTRETGAPLAERLDLEVTIDPIEGDMETWAAGFAADLLERHRGEAVLVVGHSNTLPAVMRALGVPDPPELSERDYDDLFVVTRTGDAVRVMRLNFGAANPEAADPKG